MELHAAADIFATLGHEGRLSILRLLLRRTPQAVRAGEIAEVLGIRPNTLSAHLTLLEGAGLITARRAGRSILYDANLSATRGLVDFLLNDCCNGRPDLCASALPLLRGLDMTRPYNVLFICSGNSARSIFAEALLRDLGKARFVAHSAGTRPHSELNPFALEVLERNGHSAEGLRSKNVGEFQGPDAPRMDFVFTVCDQAANETCPPWPGQPLTAHWGLPDPVKAQGTDGEKGLAFSKTYGELRRRIIAFAALPFAELEKVALQQKLDAIGKSPA